MLQEFQTHLQLISNLTGGVSNLNFIKDEDDATPPRNHLKLFDNPHIRRSLHVGDTKFSGNSSAVRSALKWTLMESVKPHLEFLLERYEVLVYTGQLDATTPYSGLAKCFYGLEWKGAEEYRLSARYTYPSSERVESFVKSQGNLTECMLRKAGHYVYKDNPKNLLMLIGGFTKHNLTIYKW